MADPEARERWWRRTRRAFEVPEDESDENARWLIERAMTWASGAYFGINETVAIAAMISAFLDLGESGGLDRLLTVEEQDYHNEAIHAHEFVYNQVHDQAWPNVTDVTRLMRLHDETDKLVDLVMASERASR